MQHNSHSSVAGDLEKSSLFSKVSLLLAGTFIISAAGTVAGSGITSGAAIIVLAVAFLLGAFLVPMAAASSTGAGIGALAVWTFISGLFLGPCIHQYVTVLGWQTVFLTYLGTGGVMAACGAIGAFSGLNFSGMGRWLMFALLGLIAVGIAAIFVPFSHTINIVWSLVGMGVFALFFIFDFFMAKTADNSWQSAILVTMQLYLDFINFLLYALKFMAEAAATGSNSDD